jgi:hypothetical protein
MIAKPSKISCIFFTIIVWLGRLLFEIRWLYIDAFHCKFRKFDKFRELHDIFDSCDERTLVTFDVDGTLITSIDLLGRYLDYSLILAALTYSSIIFNRSKFDWVQSMLFQYPERFVFDHDVVHMIKKLQQKKCKILALTSLETGSLGVISDMAGWRFTMLKSFGIDFSGQFQNTTFTTFVRYRDNYPVLYNGVLLANLQPKGAVLGAFLDQCHVRLSRIVSIDNEAGNLDSIAHECARRKISFSGYQCTSVEKLPWHWSNQRALLQFNALMQHKRWISDNVADHMLVEK